jgi:hypothetical protein
MLLATRRAEGAMQSKRAERVQRATPGPVNQRLLRETEQRLHYYASHPDEIDARLAALDQEWDIERTLEMNAASLGLAGVVLGATVSPRWFVLPAVVSGFLLQHAIQGWCPPLPVLRRLGVRTTGEIERERYALKALRGDFEGAAISPNGHGEQVRRLMQD